MHIIVTTVVRINQITENNKQHNNILNWQQQKVLFIQVSIINKRLRRRQLSTYLKNVASSSSIPQ